MTDHYSKVLPVLLPPFCKIYRTDGDSEINICRPLLTIIEYCYLAMKRLQNCKFNFIQKSKFCYYLVTRWKLFLPNIYFNSLLVLDNLDSLCQTKLSGHLINNIIWLVLQLIFTNFCPQPRLPLCHQREHARGNRQWRVHWECRVFWEYVWY